MHPSSAWQVWSPLPLQVQAAKCCRRRLKPAQKLAFSPAISCGVSPAPAATCQSVQHLQAGDFDTAAMKRMVEQYLGPWSVAEGQPPTAPAIPNPAIPPQTTAGTVRMQHPVYNNNLTIVESKPSRLSHSV